MRFGAAVRSAFLATSTIKNCTFAFSSRHQTFGETIKMSSSSLSRPDLIRKLLKGIETGDPEAAAVVSEESYIQHNPQTHEGGEGLAALFARLSKTNPRVNIVRAFQDSDYVFGHTEYDFATRRIGFEVFRFDEDTNLAVEHWDNIMPRNEKELNPSGRSMVDGPTEATDLDQTEANRALVREYMKEVHIKNKRDKLSDYIHVDNYMQHNPTLSDGQVFLEGQQYDKVHRVLAFGNFVLTASEGYYLDGVHTSFYDLFRVHQGKIVEHWDTIEAIPPKSEWKNNNGKF